MDVEIAASGFTKQMQKDFTEVSYCHSAEKGYIGCEICH